MRAKGVQGEEKVLPERYHSLLMGMTKNFSHIFLTRWRHCVPGVFSILVPLKIIKYVGIIYHEALSMDVSQGNRMKMFFPPFFQSDEFFKRPDA